MIINSWQKIADYFDVSRRTIRRWHKKHPLPVKKPHNAVMAIEKDLEDWLRKFKTNPTKHQKG